MVEAAHIVHPLEPIFDEHSRVLVLGTMPSPLSREVGFYYGHPQNRFWNVLGALFNEPTPCGNEARTAFLLEHHIALWDVLASCAIAGASDASITNPVPNNLVCIARRAPITTVFTTGTKAAALYRRFSASMIPGATHVALPSTSAAHARMSLNDLVEAYYPLVEALAQSGKDAVESANSTANGLGKEKEE